MTQTTLYFESSAPEAARLAMVGEQKDICYLAATSLRRIQQALHIRRETAGAYLRAAGIATRSPGRWGRPEDPKPANEVSTDSVATERVESLPPSDAVDPIGEAAETTGDRSAEAAPPQPQRAASASACERYGEMIVEKLSHGRNAMGIYQDLVSEHGFSGKYASVMRYVRG